MRVITIARKPLDCSTVAGNVLAHGTGALHIEATRIGHEHRVNPPAGNVGLTVALHGGWHLDAEPSEATGRWPANCLLHHLPGCTPTGQVVEFGTGEPKPADYTITGQQGACPVARNVVTGAHYGAEQVPAYTCQPGCPVAALEAQSAGASRFFWVNR